MRRRELTLDDCLRSGRSRIDCAALLRSEGRLPAQSTEAREELVGSGYSAHHLDHEYTVIDGDIYGDAWVAPDGTVIDASKIGHEAAALTITGPIADARELARAGGDQCPGCERCVGWGEPQQCVARRLVEHAGYARLMVLRGEIGVELFAPMTMAQERVIRRAIVGPNAGKSLTVDATHPTTGNRMEFTFGAASGLTGPRLRALEAANAVLAGVEAQ